ncbi:hypothetical protein BGZ65_007256 [Modicella reniformis]|uniref:Uncharacterized protein n=1 Tax=Modicella reniformis TaxID=1440133 RepID=A0A9P6MKZ4_9FUNG|nr:hypothetical protein BGZ65_007256 [Modicella reniformis]
MSPHDFVSVGTNPHHVTLDSVVHSCPDEMLSSQSAFQLSGQLILLIKNSLSRGSFHFLWRSWWVQAFFAINVAVGLCTRRSWTSYEILRSQVATDDSIQIIDRVDMESGQRILTHRATGFQNFVVGSEDLDTEDRQSWDSRAWKKHLGSEVLPGILYPRQLAYRLDQSFKGRIANSRSHSAKAPPMKAATLQHR